MKKLILALLLIISFTSYGQAEFDAGIQITGGQPTVTSTNFLTATDVTGVLTKIDPVLLPLTTATINAINTGTSGKANLSGGNSFTGNQNFASNSKFKIGLNTSYGKISVADNTNSMDSHSLDFYDVITSSVTGQGYGVVDVSSVLDGSTNNDHFMAYQARPFYIGSGDISGNFGFTGFHYQPTHSGSGTIAYARGMRIMGVLGAGPILDDIGLEIDDRARGSVNNIAIKTGLGRVIFGDEITVAGNSLFSKQLLVNGSTAGDAELAVTNASATGYGVYIKGGNASNFALRVDDYLGAVILEATQSLVKTTGNAQITGLSGTGTRQVVADASGNLSAGSIQTLKYVAGISQASTAAPTVSVDENSLSGAIVWTRTGVGAYLGTLVGAFPSGKVRIFHSNNLNTNNDQEITCARASNDTITLNSYLSTVATDGILNNLSLEIRVYP